MPIRTLLRGALRRGGITFGSLLIKVVAIVLGVLLALGVDEWREGRRAERTVSAALQLITDELTRNQRWPQRNAAYYRAMADTLDGIIDRSGPAAQPHSIPGWQGFRPTLLSDGSYQAAIATQAFADMDLQVASALATVYSLQDLYKSLFDKAATASIQGRSLPERRQMLRGLAEAGDELLGAYAEMLALLGQRDG
jgi:hypothetical protein